MTQVAGAESGKPLDRGAVSATTLHVFDGVASLIEGGARLFTDVAVRAVAERGRCTVALSGGSTPRALFALLAREPWRAQVPWSLLHVFWGDERWVPNDHPDSNYRMARGTLLDQVPVPDTQVHGMRGNFDHPDDAAAAYDALLRAQLAMAPTGVPGFDLLMLGMGPDGHTASLFPHTAAVHETSHVVVANRVDKLDADRLTITPPVMRASACTMVLVAGSEKAAMLARVLSAPVDVDALPAQLLRHDMRGPVHWLIDQAAAAELPAAGPTAASAPTPS